MKEPTKDRFIAFHARLLSKNKGIEKSREDPMELTSRFHWYIYEDLDSTLHSRNHFPFNKCF